MTHLDPFAKAVLTMRTAQKDYFKKPITGKLLAAKAAEKIVDELIDKQLGTLELPFTEQLEPEEIPY